MVAVGMSPVLLMAELEAAVVSDGAAVRVRLIIFVRGCMLRGIPIKVLLSVWVKLVAFTALTAFTAFHAAITGVNARISVFRAFAAGHAFIIGLTAFIVGLTAFFAFHHLWCRCFSNGAAASDRCVAKRAIYFEQDGVPNDIGERYIEGTLERGWRAIGLIVWNINIANLPIHRVIWIDLVTHIIFTFA